jgi:hypothetical protein
MSVTQTSKFVPSQFDRNIYILILVCADCHGALLLMLFKTFVLNFKLLFDSCFCVTRLCGMRAGLDARRSNGLPLRIFRQ